MQNSQHSSASTKQSLYSDDVDPDMFITLPCRDIQKSLPLMSTEQISYNLIQLNLISVYNNQILNQLYQWSMETKFYLENRYLLSNILNHFSPHLSKASKQKKNLHEIAQKYDSVYVNGKIKDSMKKQHQIIKHGIFKQVRAKFITEREQFILYLEELSEGLKDREKQYDAEELREYFNLHLTKLNKCELHNTLSKKKLDMLRAPLNQSFSSNQECLSEVSSIGDSPKKNEQDKTIFTMVFNGQICLVKNINIENSGFIRTKNRFPLILDFQFSRFIYKNDNQLSHELIAMHLIRYINRIISMKMKNTQIVEYQIIPESTGALYQFVENSKTVSKIKKQYPNGIVQYLEEMEKKIGEDSHQSMSAIRKRFAETFAGFSTIQYFLQLKDRNNDNIMIRQDGSIFHIDLAFIFSAMPGGINFESAPFKFTNDYLEVMGGFESDTFKYYESLMVSNLTRLFLNRNELFTKIEILSARRQQILCFKKFNKFQFEKKLPKKLDQVRYKVQQIISGSLNNWRTKKYDDYQFKTNNILP